jgi:hypothetical protein
MPSSISSNVKKVEKLQNGVSHSLARFIQAGYSGGVLQGSMPPCVVCVALHYWYATLMI